MIFSKTEINELIPNEVPIGQPLWPFKHTIEQLKVLAEGDAYVHAAQGQQDPVPDKGGMFKDSFWKYYEVLPTDIVARRIYCDTAQKTREHNDFSVFQYWVKSASMGIFLVDQARGKWEAPDLESTLVEFWNKHKPTRQQPNGAQLIKIEDKVSGTGLIQSIKKDYMIPIEGIPRSTDKFMRAMAVVKYFSSGYIHLPLNATFLFDYKDEFRKFTPMMTHKHDDQIDPTIDAVEDLIIFEDTLYNSNNIGDKK